MYDTTATTPVDNDLDSVQRHQEGWRRFRLNIFLGVACLTGLVVAAMISGMVFGIALVLLMPFAMWRFIDASAAVVQILTRRRWLETPARQRMKLMAITMPVLGLGPIVASVGALYVVYLVSK